MKMYSRLFEPDLTHQLEATGVITGDAQDVATTHSSLPGLLVRQVGGDVVNSAFDLDCGYGTGYRLALHVAVDLPAFKILRWELHLPWEDPQFQWLTDPSEEVSLDNMYQVSGCYRLEFPRNEVINHRRLLRRGHSLDGLLLGRGFESIPDLYRHGQISKPAWCSSTRWSVASQHRFSFGPIEARRSIGRGGRRTLEGRYSGGGTVPRTNLSKSEFIGEVSGRWRT